MPLIDSEAERFCQEFAELGSYLSDHLRVRALANVAHRHYFTAAQVKAVMETFEGKGAGVIDTGRIDTLVALYGRIVDEENYDVPLQAVETEDRLRLLELLGNLNCLNPMNPCGTYDLQLNEFEDRECIEWCQKEALRMTDPEGAWMKAYNLGIRRRELAEEKAAALAGNALPGA